MIKDEMIEVASITKKHTMNDIVNLTIVELALSYKAMQRLIAICELVRDTSFNYKSWLKWYKQDTNTDIALDKYIKDFSITTIKKEKSRISMIPSLQKMFLCIVMYSSKANHEQLINEYSNLLAWLELNSILKEEITPSVIKAYQKKKKHYNDLYLSLKTNHALESEILDLLTPKRFRDSSVPEDSFEGRNPFESDYFRITTSAPIRRLQDKTQIFPQEKSDFVRRRLTHSIEVSAVGRRLGLMVEKQLFEKGYLLKHGEYINRYSHSIATILETAGLVHDIGNPPFGHFGEDTIQRYFRELIERYNLEQTIEEAELKIEQRKDVKEGKKSVALSVSRMLLKESKEIAWGAQNFSKLSEEQREDFIHFDGNVQGLRILRHLGLSADDNSFNLTMPTMATIIKYPFPAKHDVIKDNHSTEKYGYYQSEKETYEQICNTLHLKAGKRHPLAYLLEAADDIVNVTSDVEDGFKMGIIGIEELKQNVNALEDKYLNFDEIEKYIKNQSDEIDCSQKVINELLVKEFRIRAVHALIEETVKIFVDNLEDIIHDSYAYEEKDATINIGNTILGNELLKTSKLRKTLSDLQKITYRDKYVLKSELLGEHVITTMLDKFIGCMFPEKFDKDEKRANKLILSSKTTEGKLYALISPNYKHAYGCKDDEVPKEPYQRFQLAVDHVSGMTDSYIVDLYNELTNRKR